MPCIIVLRVVHRKLVPDPPAKTIRFGLSTSRPDASDDRWRVSTSRTRNRLVGWRVFPPKIRKTRIDRRKPIIQREKPRFRREKPRFQRYLIILASFEMFFGQILTRYSEISLDLVEILAISDENSKDLADFHHFLAGFSLFSRFRLQPNPTAAC